MNKTRHYKEFTALAIGAMIESASKDEFTDAKRVIRFPEVKKKRDVALKDIREWNKKRIYKDDIAITVNAMMDSAANDPYVDQNLPSRF